MPNGKDFDPPTRIWRIVTESYLRLKPQNYARKIMFFVLYHSWMQKTEILKTQNQPTKSGSLASRLGVLKRDAFLTHFLISHCWHDFDIFSKPRAFLAVREHYPMRFPHKQRVSSDPDLDRFWACLSRSFGGGGGQNPCHLSSSGRWRSLSRPWPVFREIHRVWRIVMSDVSDR